MCRRGGSSLLAVDTQTRWCCTLPGFDRSLWEADPGVDGEHMGAPRDYDQEGKTSDWDRPREPAAAGCPGAWYRTAFIGSLFKFMRRVDGNGGRIENPELTRCDDPLVREAVAELEAHEDAAAAAHEEARRRHRARS